jgi:hypothetical protein
VSRRRGTERRDPIDATVIIRAQDGAAWLHEAVGTALDQVDCSLEVLVAAPAEPQLALGRRDDDAVVSHVPIPATLGPSAARNRAARMARGYWLAFLEPGDLWAPEHLATLIAACEREEADFGYCSSWVVDAHRQIRWFRAAPPGGDIQRALLTGDVIGSPSAMIVRHAFWKRAGGFDEWLSLLAPWDLWIRWSRFGHACASSLPAVATLDSDERASDEQRTRRAELRELRRRYEGDARAAGVRFGSGAPELAPPAPAGGLVGRWRRFRGLMTATPAPKRPVDPAGPPWLVRAEQTRANTTSGG